MDNDFYSNAAKGMKAGQIKIMTSILLLVARADGIYLETVHGEKLEWIAEANQV